MQGVRTVPHAVSVQPEQVTLRHGLQDAVDDRNYHDFMYHYERKTLPVITWDTIDCKTHLKFGDVNVKKNK